MTQPRNEEPERDEEEVDAEREQRSQPVEMWGGATHFHPYLVNQREYPYRPRGTVRDSG